MAFNGYQIDESYTRRAFQFSCELEVKNTVYGSVKYNGGIIYNWAKEKFKGLHMPENICSFSKNLPDQRVNVIYDFEKPYFCINTFNLDDANRVWTTDAEIILINDKLMLGVRVLYTTSVSQRGKYIDYSVPNFVPRICRKNGLEDIWELQFSAHYLTTDEDIDALYDLVQNKERKFPVVVITEKEDTGQIGSQYQSGYLINGDRLASSNEDFELGIISHIVCLNKNATQLWVDKVGTDWGVYNGAVRTYFPGVDFDEDTYDQHPFSVPNRILAASIELDDGSELTAGDAFERIIRQNLVKFNTGHQLDWKELGHKFYSTVMQEDLKEKQQDSQDTADKYAEAIQTNEVYEELYNMLDEQYKALEEEKKYIQEQLDDEKSQNFHLKSRVDTLNNQLTDYTNGAFDDIPIYDSYDKLPKWVEEYFPGKLYLHSRAKKSLKKAEFKDVELVYKALKLLGTTYRDMKMGTGVTKEEFDLQCRELGLEESKAISDTSAGEQGDTYWIDYYGVKQKLERHLKSGDRKEDRYCMRIYFFWDDDNSMVVIGSLPDHLDIKSS